LKDLFGSNCLGMKFAECETNELEVQICTNWKNIQYKVRKNVRKMPTFVNNVYKRLLTIVFIEYADRTQNTKRVFTNVYFHS